MNVSSNDPNKQAKLFLINCKPYFSNKHRKADTSIMFSENSELITKKQDVASNFNYYFGSVVENLRLFQWNEHNGEIHSKILKLLLKTSKTIPVVELYKNISKTTSLSLLGM